MYKMLENRYETLRLKRKSWIRNSQRNKEKMKDSIVQKNDTRLYSVSYEVEGDLHESYEPRDIILLQT